MKIKQITEASYEGNIGIMELMQFFKAAPPELVLKVKELMDKGANKEVWQIVQKYTGTKLKGKEFEEAINEISKAIQPHEPGYQHSLLTAPQNTLVIDKSDDMDFYKLGQHYANITKLDPHEVGVGGSDMTITFATPEEMKKMIRALDRMGVKYRDISGSHEHPEIHSETIRKIKGGYRLYSKKGKNLGTYPSKKGAEKRERQVQYFKHNESLDEAFDQPYPITMRKGEGGDYDGVAKLADGSNLEVTIDLVDEGFQGMDTFDVSFYRGNSTETTGEGDAFKVFATVMSAIKQFIMQYRRDSEDGKSPYMITFSASKAQGDAPGGNAQSRAKLYDRMVKRFANQMGYKVYVEDYEVSQEYELTRKR